MRKIILLLALNLFSFVAIAQWQKTNGPEGIHVTSFFDADTFLLCGTAAQGVFRSIDHGSTWSASSVGIALKEVTCFATDTLYLYAGTFGEGVFRSSDHGLTWAPANSGIATFSITCLLNAGGDLYAGTIGNGVYRSTDHGLTWNDANGGALGSSYILSMVYNAPRLTVEADNYLFYTYTQGGSWFVDMGTTAFYTIHDIVKYGDTLLAAAGNTLFRSTDNGINWSTPVYMNHNLVGFGKDADTVYIGSPEGIYKSADYGLTWTYTSCPTLRQGSRSLDDFAISGSNFLLAYQEIGIHRSADRGNTWSQVPLSQFARASTLDDAMTVHQGMLYAGTHSNGVFQSADQGNTWTKTGTSNPADTLSNEIIFDLMHVGDSLLFAGGCGTGLFRSSDNGNTWTHITAGLPPDNGNFTCIKTLAECGPHLLCAMTNGVFYSLDSGLTWNPTNLTGTGILQSGGFAVRDSIACVGIVGFPMPSGIYRSTDYGITWFLAQVVSDIEFMAAGGNHTMYAGELFSSYVSPDDGLSWIGTGAGAAFTILAWDNYAFIGNNDGILFSDDYGVTWSPANQGMDPYPNNSVQGLARDSQYVYAGTYRDAIWRRPLSDFGIPTGISPAAQVPTLHIYPNPSAGIFTLRFDNPDDIREIRVLNVFGQEVEQITGAKFIGQTMLLDLQHLSNGTYCVKAIGRESSRVFLLVIQK